jgi:hypothetical protein
MRAEAFRGGITFLLVGIYELPSGPGRIAEGWDVEAMFRYQSEPASGFDSAIFRGGIKAVPLPSDRQPVNRRINVNSGFEPGSASGSVTVDRLMGLGPRVKFQ